ncbi:MAG: hypothetical protein ABWY58_07785 [Aeromicrobium sp.]
MRTSLLARSVVSIASLAIVSVALAAAPATASAPSGVTRDLVLAAAQNARADTGSNPEARVLADKVCTPLAGEVQGFTGFRAVADPDMVDGILIQAEYSDADSMTRACTFAAVVTASRYDTLSGTIMMSGSPADIQLPSDDTEIHASSRLDTYAAPLSGDVSIIGPLAGYPRLNVIAEGTVIKTTTSTTTTSRTITPKTTQQKKAAKQARNGAVSSAKKAYAKALKKAGSSATKRAAAKQDFTARKKSANATYRAARAGTLTIGTTTTATTTPSPFTVEIFGGCLAGSNARC